MNSSPSDLMSYCAWAKKISGIESSLETIFMVLFSIIEIFMHLTTPLEMLLEHHMSICIVEKVLYFRLCLFRG